MDKTPEAKLLELIKGRNAPRRALRSLGARWGNRGLPFRGVSTPHAINRVLLLVFFLLLAMAFRSWNENNFKSIDLTTRGDADMFSTLLPRSGGVALTDLTKRNLFLPIAAKAVAVPKPEVPVAPPPPPIPIGQRSAHLRLTGIIAGGALQGIVEDRRKNSTSYVSAGDYLGEFRVDAVLADRVVLSFNGEKVELTL